MSKKKDLVKLLTKIIFIALTNISVSQNLSSILKMLFIIFPNGL